MQIEDLIDFNNYKPLLKAALKGLQKKRPFFTFNKMAESCHLSTVYFSRLMNSDAKHLNHDQLYAACCFLEMNAETREFVFLVYELERTEIANRQAELSEKIANLRAKFKKTEKYISQNNVKTICNEELWKYYTCPDAILVHIFLGLEKFRSDPQKIATALGIGKSKLDSILDVLKELGLVAETQDGLKSVLTNLHLSRDSMLYESYRSLIRLRGMDRIQKISNEHAYNFSTIFTGDEDTFQSIRGFFFEFLTRAKEASEASPKKEVYQMTFDLFDWSKGL